MPSKEFTTKQKEIVARRMGYDGPMTMFDEFLRSDPAMARKYGLVADKFMNRGGAVKKYAVGGDTRLATEEEMDSTLLTSPIAATSSLSQPNVVTSTAAQQDTTPTYNTQDLINAAKGQIAAGNFKTEADLAAAKAFYNISDSQYQQILNAVKDDLNKTTTAQPVVISQPNMGALNAPPVATALTAAEIAQINSNAGALGSTLNTSNNTTNNTKAPTATTNQVTGAPTVGAAPSYTATQISEQSNQLIAGTGGAGTATQAGLTTAGTAAQAAAANTLTAKTYNAEQALQDLTTELNKISAQTGTVSPSAQVTAQTGTVSSQALAQAATFDDQYKQLVATDAKRTVDPKELVTAAQGSQAPVIQAAQAEKPAAVQAMTREITEGEKVTPVTIQEKDMAQAEAITEDGLAEDAKAVAAKLDKFTADAGTLASFIQGDVPAQATVQGQLTELMKSFDDGKTPAWASGAIRAANAAMAARGLGGSSMAGAAIFQAAMESALPIAAQDAQTYATLNLQNLNNRQQVALANAAAQQNVALANFNAEQQAALQNSANGFALQSQNLSNMQQTMLANAQIRAAFQGQNLSNQMQAALTNAARQAEINNINLNNQQQAALQTSANNLQVDLANLSAKQQAAVANAQLEAALQLKNLDNQQQAAVLNASRYAEANNLTFTAQQTAILHNSELMKTIGLANMNAEQATVLQNAATYAAMDMANLNNRQQAAVLNAQAFLQMDISNLSNKQQTEMFKAQAIAQTVLSDAAATNAASQFNATSQMQTDQFFESIRAQLNQFNATQSNAMAQFNAGQTNAISQFNANLVSSREQFNAQQKLIIDQSNAEWRRNIATINTAAINQANQFNAQSALSLTTTQYNNMWQGYRDSMQYAFQAGENDADRENRLAIAKIQENAAIKAAQAQRTANAVTALGSLGATLLGKTTLGQTAVDAVSSFIKGATKAGGSNPFEDFSLIDFKNVGISPESLGIDDTSFNTLINDLVNFKIDIGP